MQKNMHLVSLGCAKNLVDSEVMLAVLENAGYTVVEDPGQAELLLVNTCGFIQPAVEEAVDKILLLAEYKEHNKNAILVVCGCLVQRYADELLEELPEVDLFVGINEIVDIADLIDQKKRGGGQVLHLQSPSFLMKSSTPRRLSTPFFQAYLKITEGCDNGCTFCLIPSMRGGLRSRSIQDLVCEAQRLEQGGVRELCLIAQDLTAYGNDLPGEESLPMLLEQLLSETDIPWFRLLYLYPTTTGDGLLALMARETRIVPYLDLPFQHVSDHVLQAMNRQYRKEDIERLVAKIREYLPECALRSTMLVGFPGETEKDVSLLIDFLERRHLDHVGVFQYQDEPGCAAYRLANKVGGEEKEERYARVMKTQARISADNIKRFVGQVEPVLVEGLSTETELLLEGRTRFQAPDIDGCVYIAAGRANPGDIVSVRITEAHTYDLVGEIIRE